MRAERCEKSALPPSPLPNFLSKSPRTFSGEGDAPLSNALTVKYKRDVYTRRERRAKNADPLNHGRYICITFVFPNPLGLF